MADEAGLALVIDPTKALSGLKQFERGIDSAANAVTDFARRVQSDFEVIGRAAGLLVAPLKAVVGAMAAAKASVLAVGIASLKTAGDFESLRMQLETILTTKQAADQAFQESLALAATTPFSAKEIVQVRAELESVGVRGSKAVRAVAEAAAAMNRNIHDVAAAVKSMETEPLRRLGIQARREGEEFVFTFRDKMGEAQRIVAQGWEQAQQAVLDVFLDKFEGGIERMSRGIQGLWSNLGDALDAIRNTFGEGFLAEAKLLVGDMIRLIQSAMGDAKQAGIAVGEQLAEARIKMLAGFATALDIAREIGKVLQQDGGVGKVILEALQLGASLLGEAILAAFKASISLWKAIGAIIGEGVLHAIYQSTIPGAGLAREWAIGRNLKNMSPAELHGLAKQYGVSAIERGTTTEEFVGDAGRWYPVKVFPYARTKTPGELASELAGTIEKLPIEEQLKYAQLDRTSAANIDKAVRSAQEELKSATEMLAQRVVGGVSASLHNLGLDIDLLGTMGRHEARIREETQARKAELAGPVEETVDSWLSEENAAYQRHLDLMQKLEEDARKLLAVNHAVVEEYSGQLREEIGLLTLSRQEQDKVILLRHADIEARKRQIDLGLEEIGLLPEQRKELGLLIDELARAEKMRAIGDSIGDGFAQGFSRATMHAKNFGDALDYLGDAAMDVVDRILQIQIWEPMAQGISQLFTQMTAKQSAMGDVFAEGRLQAFGCGGVVNRPTLFGFSNGIGVMGEAGAEAILPLKRHSSGRLGVEASVTTAVPSVSVNIQNHSQTQVETTPADVKYDGQRLLVGMILKDRRNNGPMSRGRRN